MVLTGGGASPVAAALGSVSAPVAVPVGHQACVTVAVKAASSAVVGMASVSQGSCNGVYSWTFEAVASSASEYVHPSAWAEAMRTQ